MSSQSFTRSYVVQSISQAANERMHVTLFEDNAETDAIGAPMGSNTVTFTMSKSEAKDFFPGDHVVINLSARDAATPSQ